MELAFESLALAGETRFNLNKGGHQCDKGLNDPVTVADLKIQVNWMKRLPELGISYPLIGEENFQTLCKFPELLEWALGYTGWGIDELRSVFRQEVVPNERHLQLDPIDGTRGYLNGGQYCLNFGVIEGLQVKLALVAVPHFAPCKGSILGPLVFVSDPSSGVLVYDSAQRIVQLPRVDKSALIFGDVTDQTVLAKLKRVADSCGLECGPPLYSAVKYCHVSKTGDVYVAFARRDGDTMKSWDHTPAGLVEAVGGRVTDVCGNPLDFSKPPILPGARGILAAPTPEMHQRVLNALREEFPYLHSAA